METLAALAFVFGIGFGATQMVPEDAQPPGDIAVTHPHTYGWGERTHYPDGSVQVKHPSTYGSYSVEHAPEKPGWN